MSAQISGYQKRQPISPYIVVIFACILPISLCGFVVWLPKFINDHRLLSFANNLYDYPLPPDTTIISQYSELSKVGNGNNCFYKAEQSMLSKLPRTDIEQYYESVMVPRVSFGRQWDERYDSPAETPIDLEFDESKSNEDSSYFTLTIFDAGLDITLDYRCH